MKKERERKAEPPIAPGQEQWEKWFKRKLRYEGHTTQMRILRYCYHFAVWEETWRRLRTERWRRLRTEREAEWDHMFLNQSSCDYDTVAILQARDNADAWHKFSELRNESRNPKLAD